MNWKKLFNERRSSEVYNVRLPVKAAGDEVALHMNLAGEVDKVGDPVSLLIMTGTWTFVMLLVGFSAYRPRLMNPPTRITTVKQLKLAVTQMRAMNIILGIMGICLLLSMVYETPVWVLIPAGLLFIEVIVFSILIRRAGK